MESVTRWQKSPATPHKNNLGRPRYLLDAVGRVLRLRLHLFCCGVEIGILGLTSGHLSISKVNMEWILSKDACRNIS